MASTIELSNEFEKLSKENKALSNQLNQERFERLKDQRNLEASKETIRKLQAEGSHQRQQAITLEAENSDLKGKLVQLTREIQGVAEEREAAKLYSSALKSSYNSLQKLFTETSDHYNNSLVSIQANLQVSTDENKELRSKLKSTEDQLQEEKKLRQTSFNDFGTEINQTSDDTLNKLIYGYTQINEHPQDIFKDFFKIKDSYEKAVKENVGLAQMVEHLTRKLTEQNNLLSRQHQEMEERKDDVADVQKSLEKESIKYNKVKSDRDNIFIELQESLKENQDLEKTISDLKYQMKFILNDIEIRGELIPGQLHETFKLLEDTSIVPNLSHEQLAFKNISMLQEKNMDLVLDLRKANELVENLKNDYQNLKSSSENNKNVFENTLNESQEAIKSLQEQLTEVKADNESHINQLSALKSGLASSSSVNSAVQNQAQTDEDTEMTFNEFRRETLLDAEKMPKELFEARKELAELKAQSQSWSTEKNLLQLDAMKLNNQVTLLQAELQRVNASSEDRLNKINELDQQITSTQHLADEAKIDASINEQRLQLAYQARDDLREIVNQKSTEYESLMHVFQQLSNQVKKKGSNNCDTLLQKIESLSSKLEEKTILLAAKNTEIDLINNDKETALREAQSEIRILTKQLADTQDNLIKTGTEKSLAEAQLDAIRNQVNSNDATTEDATEHNSLIQTYQNKIADIENVNFAYKNLNDILHQRVDELMSQLSGNASNAELKKNGNDSSKITTQLETELMALKKQLDDSSVEIPRYRDQASMAQTKTTELQKEVEALKIKLAESIEADETVVDKMVADKTVACIQPNTNERVDITHAQSLSVQTPQPTEQSEARSPFISQVIQVSPVREEQAAEVKTREVPQTRQASPMQEEYNSEVEVPQSDKVELVATMESETPAAVPEADKLEQDIDVIDLTGDDDVELVSPTSLRIPKRKREDEEEDGTKANKLEQDIGVIDLTGDDDVELVFPSSPRIPKREREDDEEDVTEYPTKKLK